MVVPELIVFDLTGTTVHDRGDVPVAFSAALEASGLAADPKAYPSWRGASKREVLNGLVTDQQPTLPDDKRKALVASAYDHFSVTLVQRLRASDGLAMPDAVAAFDRFKRAGTRVAINSGFDRSTVDIIFAAVGWPEGLLDAVVCSDDVPAGRPAPYMIFRSMERTGVTDVRRVAVVGDTRLDLEAGANGGVAYRVGVLTGAHDRSTLERAPFTHIVPSVGAVPGIWLG